MIKKFLLERSGIIAIYVAILLPFLIGLASLAVDASRLFILRASLQNAADALAIAGASALDGTASAYSNSTNEMEKITLNRRKFSSDSIEIEVVSDADGNSGSESDVEWRFLSTLPSEDWNSFNYSRPDHKEAKYIWIRIRPSSFTTIFPLSFFDAIAPSAISATAIAGRFPVTGCYEAPLFMCADALGFTGSTPTIQQIDAKKGTIIEVHQRRSGEPDYFSGQFSLLNPGGLVNGECNAGGSTNNTVSIMAGLPIRRSGANCTPAVCLTTGYVNVVEDAINTRFDIYSGSFNVLTDEQLNYLAPDSRSKWFQGQAGCETPRTPGKSAAPLPLYPVGIETPAAYASRLYGVNVDANSDGVTTWAEVHDYELTTTSASTYIANENTCFSEKLNGTLAPLNAAYRNSRRSLTAAIVDCAGIDNGDYEDTYPDADFRGASTTPLPIITYGDFFLTTPVNKYFINLSFTGSANNQRVQGSSIEAISSFGTYTLDSNWGPIAIEVNFASTETLITKIAKSFNAYMSSIDLSGTDPLQSIARIYKSANARACVDGNYLRIHTTTDGNSISGYYDAANIANCPLGNVGLPSTSTTSGGMTLSISKPDTLQMEFEGVLQTGGQFEIDDTGAIAGPGDLYHVVLVR